MDELMRVRAVMRCGHMSNALRQADDGERKPACSLCIDSDPVGAKTPIDLAGRTARCKMGCGEQTPSKATLREFRYRPDRDKIDEYYDGCEDRY